MVDAFEDVIIPRETLIAMTASLSSRHGRFDPEVVGRMVGADPLDIPRRIADYAYNIWENCRGLAADAGLTREQLLEVVVMTASMTNERENTAETFHRAIKTMRACEQVMRLHETIRRGHKARIEEKVADLQKFKSGNLKLSFFLRPFFAKTTPINDMEDRLVEFFESQGNDKEWVERAMKRFREKGVPVATIQAYSIHFKNFLKNRLSAIRSTKGKMGMKKKKASKAKSISEKRNNHYVDEHRVYK